MSKITTTIHFFGATLGALLLSAHIGSVFAQENPNLSRTILLEKKLELASKKITANVVRVSFPPAFKTPQHTHKGPGPRYVAKGKLKVTEGNKTATYSVGEVFWESGQLMTVENIGEGPAELIIFEMAPQQH